MNSLGLMYLPIDEVELDRENPRIKQYLEIYGDSITSEHIALALSYSGNGDSSTSYQTLKESIKVSKGIIHPIVVNKGADGKYVVIEGNTRLQIYKEFNTGSEAELWAKIPCLVYDQLTEEDKHKIRLQSHLVGPREWDAYSKAKYLYELSEELFLPMQSIISMCGGKKNDIIRAIDAYKCMHFVYEPLVEEMGFDKDIREYSKFSEYQNSKIKQALASKGFSDKDFARWVISGNIDNAMKVRCIPAVFANPTAFETFKTSNISEAEKLLVTEPSNKGYNLEGVPYEVLCKALSKFLDGIEYKEIKMLANNPGYEEKKNALITLADALEETIDEIRSKES